jgi:hypothetical protein
MDDIIERLDDVCGRLLGAKTRVRGGAGGQTIEATAKATVRDISDWDLETLLDVLTLLRAIRATGTEIARLTALQSKESVNG